LHETAEEHDEADRQDDEPRGREQHLDQGEAALARATIRHAFSHDIRRYHTACIVRSTPGTYKTLTEKVQNDAGARAQAPKEPSGDVHRNAGASVVEPKAMRVVNERDETRAKTLKEVAETLYERGDMPATVARVGLLVAAAFVASSLPTLNIDQRARIGAKRLVEEVFGSIAEADSGALRLLSKRVN
jgi:hypothetical protein